MLKNHRLGFVAALVAAVLVLSDSPSAQADLVWEFNTVTKTASLNGTSSTVFTPDDFGSGSVVFWFTDVTIPGGSQSLYQTSATALYNLATPILISNDPNNNSAGYEFDPIDDLLPSRVVYFLSINGNTPPAPATITGNGVGINYSGWHPNVIAYFEGFTPSAPLILQSITGGASLTVYALPVAVPEPASLSLLTFGCLGLFALRRRRKA